MVQLAPVTRTALCLSFWPTLQQSFGIKSDDSLHPWHNNFIVNMFRYSWNDKESQWQWTPEKWTEEKKWWLWMPCSTTVVSTNFKPLCLTQDSCIVHLVSTDHYTYYTGYSWSVEERNSSTRERGDH